MSEQPIAYALTTKSRVKDRLGLTTGNFDTLLDRLIAAATDLIESACNRKFLYQTYTNEVYSIYNQNQKMLPLNNVPVGTVTAVQYRFGLKTSPNWTDFNTNDWEVVGDGKSGLIRIWGLPAGASTLNALNSVRVSYTAGYLIDFSNAGSPTAHTLPFDLSDLCERLVTKMFKRREHEGKISETFEGTTVSWDKLISDDDKDIMNGFKRLPVFI